MADLADQVASILNLAAVRIRPLSGGCIGDVSRVDLSDGRSVVAKSAGPRGTLDIEGWMLTYLAERSDLPVPRVLHSSPSLLLMEHIEGESVFSTDAECHAADLLAALHALTAPHFGLERDTLIGSLQQVNTPRTSWVDFFREHRLLAMARQAADAGRLERPLHDRIRRLADALPSLIDEPDQPSLIHGDVWTTNVLTRGGRISAFLDPAISYSHPEIELAFITLFETFSEPFFERYNQLRPIRPGFFERRRDIYNLYPLLVHVRLFGGGYASQVANTLRGLGF